MHYERHAREVVNRFKRMLETQVVEEITEEHFQELETLIAAALGVIDSQARHEISEKVNTLAKELKQLAGQVDSHYLDDLKPTLDREKD
ncbi:MAG: hypothetical protein R3219_06300 [Hydrogenovibrio sp.]|nr:hypothetical protein [Hydrogenovibrio sp.]